MEVEGRAEDLAKMIVDMAAQCHRWKEDNVKLKEEVMKVKGKEERRKEKYIKEQGKCEEIREKFDSEKMKWREENEKIREKYWEVEVKKRELTIDLEAALSQQRAGGVERATDAEVERLESSLKERDIKITNLLEKIEALDRHNNILERDFKDKMAMEAKKLKIEEEKNSKLIQEIQALERYKEQMMAVVSNLQKEKSKEAEKSFAVKKALEAEKKRSVEIEGKNFELAKKIVEFGRTKISMQDEISKLHMAKSEEVKKMLREKLAADVERKVYEDDLRKMVAVLVKEKKEMKAQLSRETMEKDADIKRILKEQMALKEEGQKMILERDEAIKVLSQENKTLEAQNKQLQMEKTRLAQQAHLVSNVVSTLSTPAAQIQDNSKTEDRMPVPTAHDRYSAFLREFDRSKAL